MSYAHSHEVAASLYASRRVLPGVIDLIHKSVSPRQQIVSAVDYGGGTGAWMSTLFSLGVVAGKVIDAPLPNAELLVPVDSFIAADLSREIPLAGRFDLAMCLEVAEHVPYSKSATLVKALVSSAPVVFFSAAIPGQPGLGHINCQPHEFWHELFEAENYNTFDVIRPLFLRDSSIPAWYRQNCFLYMHSSLSLADDVFVFPKDMELISKIYFRTYTHPSLRFIAKRLVPALCNSIRFRFLQR